MTTIYRDLFTENIDTDALTKKEILLNIPKSNKMSLYKQFASPVPKKGIVESFIEITKKQRIGKDHLLYIDYQNKYGNGLSENLCVPYLDTENQCITDIILVNHPQDAERIAGTHIQKMPNFLQLLHDGVISTTDNKHWKRQRMDLIGAFTPMELNKILPISHERAKKCSSLLWTISNNGENKVNMSEFFLNETQAQLQLALYGMTDEFQEETNSKIRKAFGGGGERGYVREFALRFLEEAKSSVGPLAIALTEREAETQTEAYGNALLFTFAGHDTTGHTLTWLLYELSKNTTLQIKLQREIDYFWLEQGDTPIHTRDFKRLPFLTRCIMETLRLWTAVPNGTFRQLIHEDTLQGLNGPVKVPAGTYVQIMNYSRHRNTELWGDDANEFNPEREFKEGEVWEDTGHAFYNPASDRFSPFTFPPRDCIGKNFAQIEMRLMLLYLFKDYNFVLTEEQSKRSFNYEGINRATLSPPDIYDPINKNNKGFRPINAGMYVYVIPRKLKGKL